ncbi:MAG: metal-dependent transcriptional regulator [Chloroflexaceae bacterium]|nr:metal-dependent transcriptional regulator [Chloroflexaceae bacterium]
MALSWNKKYSPEFCVKLTEVAHQLTHTTQQHHQLVRQLLVEVFGFTPEEVQADADVLEQIMLDVLEKKMIPTSDGHYHLSVIPAGSRVQVGKITGGVRMMHTLAQSGIFHGVHLHVLRNDWGRIIVSVDDRRVALNRDVAYKVMVSHLNGDSPPP